MKKQWVLAGPFAALAIMVAACTSGAEKPSYDERYLKIDNVKTVDCKTVDLVNLEATLHYVEKASDASGGTIRDILKRNPEGTTKDQLKEALSTKVDTCKKERENNYQTVAEDGTGWQLPMAPDNVDILVGDSTKDPDTPPVMSMPALPEKCRSAINWTMVRDCAGTEKWYVDGINLMKPFSGFDWNDVERWAEAKRVDGTPVGDARLVQVFGMGTKQSPQISEGDTKKGVASLIGNDKALDRMGVAYHDENFVNTRGLENERVSPFIDPSAQVRVSIAPLILNEKGEAIKLNPVGGIFVDCWNIWGKAFAIAPAPGKPALCPGTNMPIPPEGPKGCNPPGTSTPPTTNTTSTCVGCTTTTTTPPVEIKDSRKGSNNQQQFDVGGKQEQTTGAAEPPPIVVTTTRQNPPPPPPPPAGTQPPPVPTDTGTPPPTNPGAGTSITGTVPPP